MKSFPQRQLQEFAEIKHGFAFRSEFFSNSGKYVLLTPGNFREEGGFRWLGEKQKYYVGDIPNNYVLNKGDLLIAMTEQAPGLLGSAILIPEDDRYLHNQRLGLLQINKRGISKHFLYHVFNSPIVRKPIAATAAGTKVKHTSPIKIVRLSIPVPPIEQQIAIANLLSTWDAAIEKTEELIAAKEKRFLWLQNDLMDYTKAIEDWKKLHLGDVAEIIKKAPVESVEGRSLLTVKLHCLGIEANTRIKPKLTKRGRPYYIRNTGEFIIGRQNFHNGGFGIVPEELDGYIASNAITSLTVDKERLDPDFLFFYFSRPNYYKRVGHIMDGTGQKELSDKQILKLTLSLPDITVQKRIADTLNHVRVEIFLLKNIANAYQKQKRGLMQKMLIGQWRVKS